MPNPAPHRSEDPRPSPQAAVPKAAARVWDFGETPSREQLDVVVRELKEWQRDHPDRDAQGYYDRLQRACSWLAKARTASDPEARFVFSWIALNALCGVRRVVFDTSWWKTEESSLPSVREHKRDDDVPRELEWFLWRICDLDVDQQILRSVIEDHWDDVKMILRTPYLMPKYWAWRSRTENDFEGWGKSSERTVKDAIGPSVDREKMYRALREITVWRLRTLRNQLFHGSATDTHSKRRDSGESELEAGERLLGELVWAFLRLLATESGRAKYWPPIPYPRARSAQHQPFDNSWLPTTR